MKFMMQDCFLVSGETCTAGSKILYNFKAPFSATVYEKCLSKGMKFCGLVSFDEFGIDSLFDSCDEQDAAISALLENKCDAVICNDIFGKLRRQAPQNGLVYIQPAYGTVSRYGLVPTISSMDQAGVLCRELNVGIEILNTISGHDINDGTSLSVSSYSYNVMVDKKAEITFIKPDEIKYFDVMAQAFYVLGTAEISNNTNRYDGVKFGYRAENTKGINDLYIKSRSETLGRDLQLASVVGCMVLSQEHYDELYDKSMRVRRLIRDYYNELFEKIDALALPVKIDGCGKYEQSALYALSLLGGFSSVSMMHKNTAVQLVCRRGKEGALFALAEEGLK